METKHRNEQIISELLACGNALEVSREAGISAQQVGWIAYRAGLSFCHLCRHRVKSPGDFCGCCSRVLPAIKDSRRSSKEVSAEIGIPEGHVSRIRARLGITRSGQLPTPLPDEILDPQLKTGYLSFKYDVSAQTIYRVRKKAGVTSPKPRWTKRDAMTALELWNKGTSLGEIAKRLHRTAHAVELRLSRLRTMGYNVRHKARE